MSVNFLPKKFQFTDKMMKKFIFLYIFFLINFFFNQDFVLIHLYVFDPIIANNKSIVICRSKKI